MEDIVIPSEEEHVEVFPMNYEEFLWAMGNETTVPYLRDCFELLCPLGETKHRRHCIDKNSGANASFLFQNIFIKNCATEQG